MNPDCCGAKRYDRGSKICCGGKITKRIGNAVAWCGTEPQLHTICCEGKIKTTYGMSFACCGETAYDQENKECCSPNILKNRC